jgi:hypothetical protein
MMYALPGLIARSFFHLGSSKVYFLSVLTSADVDLTPVSSSSLLFPLLASLCGMSCGSVFLVGMTVGVCVVGVTVGRFDGVCDGEEVGLLVGLDEGLLVGRPDGTSVGLSEGVIVGGRVGVSEGEKVGARVGTAVGTLVGGRVGFFVGIRVVGAFDGVRVGA